MSESDKVHEDEIASQSTSNIFSKSSGSLSKSTASRSEIERRESITLEQPSKENNDTEYSGEKEQAESHNANVESQEIKDENTESAEPIPLPPELKKEAVIEQARNNAAIDVDLEFQEVSYAKPNLVEETFDDPIVLDEVDGVEIPQVSVKQQELQSKKPKPVRIEDNVIIYSRWPTSARAPSRFSHYSEKNQAQNKRNESSPTPAMPEFSVQKENGKYTEIPHLLDGFRMLNQAPAEDPDQVYALDLSRKCLEYVIEDDMTMFINLHTLIVAENALPFARLGQLPALRKLNFSCNGLKSLDLEVDGRFQSLEFLDLSFNNIDRAALIVLATLPNLNTLNLTSNKIRTIHPDIVDMHNWRDNVIELILPLQVAAMDFDFESNAKSTDVHSDRPPYEESHKGVTPVPNFKIESYEQSDAVASEVNSSLSDQMEEKTQGSFYDAKLTGYQTLHTLILDKNPLGNSADPQLWNVLGLLPSIQKLSLNYAHIKSLRPIIPDSLLSKTGPEIILMHADILPKSKLFLSLTDLYLTHNLINDFDCLVGFICLSKLKRIYLEGNPVMKSFIPKHLLSKRRASSAKLYEEFDLYSYLERVFKIKISDACFQPPLSHNASEFITVAPSHGTNPALINSKKGPREFLHKRINKFRSNMYNPHTVKDVKMASRSQIQERTARRHYQFKDEDLENIVKTGKLPTVKSLMEFANKKQQESTAEPKEEIKHAIAILESNTESSESHSLQDEKHEFAKPEEFNYDPNKKDETFLTGVHITGSMTKNVNFDIPPEPQQPESDHFEYESESDNEGFALPSSIIASVKALRSSLRNPGNILRQSNVKKKSTLKRELPGAGSITKLHQQKCQGKLVYDEFEEMNDLIGIVNMKMGEIEENLLSALENSKIKNYLPANKDMIVQVKQEYEDLAKKDQLLIEAFYNFGGEKGSLKAIKAHIGDPNLKLKDIKERKKVLLGLLKNEHQNVQDENGLASNPTNLPPKKIKKPKKQSKPEDQFEDYLVFDQSADMSAVSKETVEPSKIEPIPQTGGQPELDKEKALPKVAKRDKIVQETPADKDITPEMQPIKVPDNIVKSKIEMLGKGVETQKTAIEMPAEMESVKSRTAQFETAKSKKTSFGKSRVKRLVANIESEQPSRVNIKGSVTPFKFDSLFNKKSAFEHQELEKPALPNVAMTPSRRAAVTAKRVSKSKLSSVESDGDLPVMSSPLRRSSRISFKYEGDMTPTKKLQFEDIKEENMFNPVSDQEDLKSEQEEIVDQSEFVDAPVEAVKKIATPRKRVATPRKRITKIDLETPEPSSTPFSFGKFEIQSAPPTPMLTGSEGSKRKREEDDEGEIKRFKLPNGERQIKFQRMPETNSTWFGSALYRFSKPFLYGLGN
ncbi:hypothetical protein HDV01_006972 [Terramyces sp. JEL0728]|nr:hypothetical protein HDV01_006972 [Terramyces sp. JEL0728]